VTKRGVCPASAAWKIVGVRKGDPSMVEERNFAMIIVAGHRLGLIPKGKEPHYPIFSRLGRENLRTDVKES